jgi:hypothetical protein
MSKREYYQLNKERLKAKRAAERKPPPAPTVSGGAKDLEALGRSAEAGKTEPPVDIRAQIEVLTKALQATIQMLGDLRL